MFGFHIIDIIAITLYFISIIFIGFLAKKRIKGEEDYFLGGRKFGKLVSIFLVFGAGTSSDTAITASRETYRLGMSGIWVQLLWLFVTPIYWILAPWYRRLRVITGGDYFYERFNSKGLTYLYVCFGILWFMFFIAIGLTAIGKTVEIVTAKPEIEYTIEEKISIQDYNEFQELKTRKEKLIPEQIGRLKILSEKSEKLEIRPFYSYINTSMTIPVIALIIILYGILGGMFAAAWTDTLQGILIIILSVILLPTGLHQIGWFSGLHENTPAYMFQLVGSVATSEYTWYYIIALMLMNLVGVAVQPHMFSTGGGGAKDEQTARIGLVVGNYLKRFTTIMWGFTGVVTFALFGKVISDPDMIWGYATKQLLGPGFVGLMVACLLAALMSSADAFMISGSALFTKNLYQPLNPNKNQKHYVFIGRIVSFIIILGSVALSFYFNNVLTLIKYIWQLPVIFGAVFWLSLLWRKITTKAAYAAVIYSGLTIILLPSVLPQFNGIALNKKLLIYTNERYVNVKAGATKSDIEFGLANKIGDVITKKHVIKSVPVLFEKIIEVDSPSEGKQLRGNGRISPNLFCLHLLGFQLTNFSKSGLMTLSYFMDIILPFVIMILVSLFTKPVDGEILNRFYSKFHTPVHKIREEDDREVKISIANPQRFAKDKLFPNSSLEIIKPNKKIVVGFMVALGVAFLLMLFAFTIAHIKIP